jgi:outer membrane biosynthesis protein TonB
MREMQECTNAPMQKRAGRALVHWCILAFLVVNAFNAAACAKAHAKAQPDTPPLDVPAPPPRDVEPLDTETPQPVPLPQEPARTAPPRARPAPPRPEAAKPPGAPAEAPKPDVQPPSEPPKPEEPPKPATPLQITPAATEGETERGIRATIARATSDLNRVDSSRLNAGARTQYDTARGLLRQADAAVRAKNLVFAKTLADKAAVLAAQLAPK